MGAPLNPVPSVLRVVANQTAGGRPVANILHWQYSGPAPSGSTCVALAGLIAGAWASHVASLQIATTVLQSVTVTDLTSTSAGSGTSVALVAGTRGDDELPGNAAVLINYPSVVRYKGGHLRTYLMALGFADLQDTVHWTTATAGTATSEVKVKWDAFLAAVLGSSSASTVMSQFVGVRYRGKFLPNSGPPHYYLNNPIVVSIAPGDTVAEQQIASQRRRIGRVRK